MRIQETNEILKEARYSRQSTAQQHEEGVMSRVWRAVSTKLAGLFHK